MLPRILANENVPAPSIAKLRVHGVNVLAIAETCSGITDIEVLSIAEQHRTLEFKSE